MIKTYLELLSKIREKLNFSNEDIALLDKAYLTAERLHSGMKRRSGDNYIVHPLNVAFILVNIGADVNSICAALLHDTVEDTNYTVEEIKIDFNDAIATLVNGLTKLTKLDFESREESDAANIKRNLLSITKDIRIIYIKLADRLHNMQTLDFMPDSR
ncbi:MAG: HD domain-containing protein, partial [Bacilli bacterium]